MKPQQSSIFFFLNSITFAFISFFYRKSNIVTMKFSVLELNSAQYNLEMYFDWKLLSFISIMSFITGNIMMYSEEYMKSDKFKSRFTIILSLFAMSMIWTMLTSKNIMSMLIGWDYLGLSSLLLIIHYQSKYVYNYGMITFILNRIGDIMFIMAGAYMFSFGSWSILTFMEYSNTIMMFLTIAAFTKSAQLPFSSWLPKAMAAPTPVSALVHSSTLVTAGVILLIRIEPMSINPKFSKWMFFISVMTMFVGSIMAIIDNDMKKIIAFSTLSQISFMMVILNINGINLAFFHLLIHALFKSLMFMTAGTIIHHSGGEQDIRKINMMSNWLPLESMMLIVSMMALMGFPFYSGFYSKDLMIEYYMNYKINIILSMMLDLSICMTTIYAARLSYYMCWNKSMKNISFNYSTSKYEKMVMMMFSMPIISSGAMMSWIFSKNFNMEVPIPLYMKTFGLWGMMISLIIVMWMNKTKLIMKKYYTWFIMTMIFIDTSFLNIMKLILIISNMYNNLSEKMWNNFFSIISIMSFKNIMKNNKMFYPLNMIKNSIIIIIIMMMLLML